MSDHYQEAERVITMPSRTYSAKLFKAAWEGKQFSVAGTLDGFIDLALPDGGTYPLSLEEAKELEEALRGAVADSRSNCLHERDSLLAESPLPVREAQELVCPHGLGPSDYCPICSPAVANNGTQIILGTACDVPELAAPQLPVRPEDK